MANPWFRLWTDMVNDPKFRTIARVAKQEVSRVLSVYLHIMTCASNATERGRTEGWSDEDVATALDIDTADVTAIREAMQGRVLDGDYLTGWEKRQPLKEDDSAARAKAWRDAKKAAKEQEQTTPNETERSRTQEEIREEEKREEKSKASCAEPQSDSTPAVVGIPLNTGKEFGITERQASEWQLAYPAVDVIRQLAAMRQWCLANPAKRKTARGVLAFCNSWLMREQDKPRAQPQPGVPPAAAPKPVLPVEVQVPALAPMQRSGRPANFDSIKQGLKARESP